MKLNENFIVKNLGETTVLIPTNQNVDLSGVIKLNETGVFLYQKLKEKIDENFLANELVKEYSVDFDLALNDSKAFIQKLKETGVIIE